MRARPFFFTASFILVTVSCNSSSPTLPESTPGGGWVIITEFTSTGVSGTEEIQGDVEIDGDWKGDLAGAAGNAQPFGVVTNSQGFYALTGKRAPATWQLNWVSSPSPGDVCDGTFTHNFDVSLNQTVPVICGPTFVQGAAFSVSPNPINTASPPSSATITGSGFSGAYGMPLIQYFDLGGTLVAQENASSVSSDGTSLQAPVGSLSSVIPGIYVGVISNAGSNGSYSFVGAAEAQVIGPLPAGTAAVDLLGIVTGNDGNASYPVMDTCCNSDGTNYLAGYVDAGTVSVTVSGFTKSVNYGGGDTGTTIGTALTTAFNSDSHSPVTASSSGGVLFFTTKSGSGPTPSVSISSLSTAPNPGPPVGLPTIIGIPSATFTGTGTVNLIGIVTGNSDNPSYTVMDTCCNSDGTNYLAGYIDVGTVSIAVNGFNESVNYAGGDTGTTIATALAAAFNADSSSPVTTSATNGSLTLTSKSGSGTVLSVLTNSASTNPNPGPPVGLPMIIAIPSATFTGSGTVNLIGIVTGNSDNPSYTVMDTCCNSDGTNYLAGYIDAGTVSVTVNGFTKSVNYGGGDTGTTIATALAAAFNAAPSSPVTASATNGSLTLTSKSGSGTVLSVLATSASTNPNPGPPVGLPMIIAIPTQP